VRVVVAKVNPRSASDSLAGPATRHRRYGPVIVASTMLLRVVVSVQCPKWAIRRCRQPAGSRSRIDPEELVPAPNMSTEVEVESLRHDCWTAVATTNGQRNSMGRRPVLSRPTVDVCFNPSLSTRFLRRSRSAGFFLQRKPEVPAR
jgi:hypothetical protein